MWKNVQYDVRKPMAEERRRQKVLVLFQMTYVGAPMIYYGDEAGMWGANDPCCRKPMVWPELAYDAERTAPDGTAHEPDEVGFDGDMHAWYRRLIRLRHASAALREGAYETVLCDDAREVLAFKRSVGEDTAVVVINTSDCKQRVALGELRCAGMWKRVLTGKAEREVVELEAVAGEILVLEKRRLRG